jgi:hypothetical protein
MKLPAITNATLTAVTGAGFSDDYDDAATAGASKWSGSEDVFYRTSAERIDAGGSSDVIVGRSLVVSDALAVDFEIGDVLSWTYRDEAQSATVRRVAPTTAPDLAGVVRLVIEDG